MRRALETCQGYCEMHVQYVCVMGLFGPADLCKIFNSVLDPQGRWQTFLLLALATGRSEVACPVTVAVLRANDITFQLA